MLRVRLLLLVCGVLFGMGSSVAQAIYIHNMSNDTLDCMVMSAYDGNTSSDGNYTFRPAFRLLPGESKEIHAKFMSTNTFWLVAKNARTGNYLSYNDTFYTASGRKLADIRSAICYSPSSVSRNVSNEFVSVQMIRDNWLPLRNSGIADLKRFTCMRIKSTLPHNLDPGFTIRITNTGLSYRMR